MSDKRVDYITWDEYFMELPLFPADVPKTQAPRWGHAS